MEEIKFNELSIYAIFNEIIKKSKVMNRFVVSPSSGDVLLANNLKEDSVDAFGGINDAVKYPLALLFPPVEQTSSLDYSILTLTMMFLTTSFSGNSGLKDYNSNLNSSNHTVAMDWKDMRGAAIDFLKVLKIVLEKAESRLFLNEDGYVLERYGGGTVSNDNLAGVSLQFGMTIFNGCFINDFDLDEIEEINPLSFINIHNPHKH